MPLNSTASVTGRVTPLIVRSPSTSNPSPERRTAVVWYSIVGWLAASKKSVLRRCASRSASRVSIEPRSTVSVAARPQRVRGREDRPRELVERPSDLRDHQASNAEPDLAMRHVELPGPRTYPANTSTSDIWFLHVSYHTGRVVSYHCVPATICQRFTSTARRHVEVPQAHGRNHEPS